MIRPVLAEAVGTALLSAAVIGAGQGAAALGPVGLIPVSAVVGLALFVLITVFSRVSGGHVNPVVSLLFLARGDIGGRQAVAYAGAQVTGAVAGVVLVHAMFGLPLVQAGVAARAAPSLWLSETVAAFTLILAIAGGCMCDPRWCRRWSRQSRRLASGSRRRAGFPTRP